MEYAKFKFTAILKFILFFLVLAIINSAFAQERPGFGRQSGVQVLTGDVNMREIGGVLSLTDEQKEQLRDIIEDHRRESRLELFSKISPILNDEQRAILHDIKADLEEKKMPKAVIDNRIKRLETQLDLNQKQKEQLTGVFSVFGDRIISIRDANPDRNKRRDAMREQFDALYSELEAILLPEQMEKLARMNKNKRERIGRKMGYRDRGGMYQEVLNELELSMDQQAKIQEILEQAHTSFQQKMQDIDDPEERKTAMRTHRAEVAAQIETELTAEQKEKFAEMKDESRRRHDKHRHRWQ